MVGHPWPEREHIGDKWWERRVWLVWLAIAMLTTLFWAVVGTLLWLVIR